MPVNGVTNANLLDLWITTLNNLPWEGQHEVLLSRHDHPILNEVFDPTKVQSDGGTQLTRKLQYRESGNADWVRPAAVRDRSIVGVLVDVSLPWCGIQTSHSMVAAEMRRNLGKAKLISMAKVRRTDAMLDMADKIEPRLWATIDNGTDDLHPYGINYHIPPITGVQVTTQAGDDTVTHFRGANPVDSDGPTDLGEYCGVDVSDDTYARMRSYNDVWDNSAGDITEDGLTKMGRMFRRLHWRSPKLATDLEQGTFSKIKICTAETVLENLEKQAKLQNDQVGADLGRYMGATLFKGLPIEWSEDLDTTTYPLFMLNLNYIFPVIEQDTDFREDTPMRDIEQPDVFSTYVDLAFQLLCTNRQRVGGRIDYVAAA